MARRQAPDAERLLDDLSKAIALIKSRPPTRAPRLPDMIDSRKTRESIGYTKAKQNANPRTWVWLALGFHAAATVLHDHADSVPNNSRPFALNAGYSLELVLKAILAQNGDSTPDKHGHNLVKLCELAGIQLTLDQITTIEDFEQIIVWLGRYPAPKKEEAWDNYNDVLLPKTMIKETTRVGNTTVGSTRVNPATFANWQNYKKLWDMCIENVDPKFMT